MVVSEKVSNEALALAVQFHKVDKRFGAETILRDVSFSVPAGKLCALLGPSGAGKTTILRILAGLETIDRGQVWLDGEVVNSATRHKEPSDRGVSLLFQAQALWPHMTVRKNAQFVLGGSGLDPKAIRLRIETALETFGLEELAHRYPAELSGGERQRVALVRALVVESPLLLLDEPLAHLNVEWQEVLFKVLAALRAKTSCTVLLASHEQDLQRLCPDQVLYVRRGSVTRK